MLFSDWLFYSSYYNGTDSGGECGVPYEKRFIMPRPAINKHWYVCVYVHVYIDLFVCLSACYCVCASVCLYMCVVSHLSICLSACACLSVTPYRYGFDYGNVHVVMMSTEHDFTANSEQLQFLEDHLKTVNREKTPWLIFAGHRPMYVDSTYTEGRAGDQPVAALLRTHVEPLLKVIQQCYCTVICIG